MRDYEQVRGCLKKGRKIADNEKKVSALEISDLWKHIFCVRLVRAYGSRRGFTTCTGFLEEPLEITHHIRLSMTAEAPPRALVKALIRARMFSVKKTDEDLFYGTLKWTQILNDRESVYVMVGASLLKTEALRSDEEEQWKREQADRLKRVEHILNAVCAKFDLQDCVPKAPEVPRPQSPKKTKTKK